MCSPRCLVGVPGAGAGETNRFSKLTPKLRLILRVSCRGDGPAWTDSRERGRKGGPDPAISEISGQTAYPSHQQCKRPSEPGDHINYPKPHLPSKSSRNLIQNENENQKMPQVKSCTKLLQENREDSEGKGALPLQHIFLEYFLRQHKENFTINYDDIQGIMNAFSKPKERISKS